MNYYAKSRQVGECVEWIGAKDRLGYGRTSYLGRKGITVHRAVWLQAGREIPPSTELDHVCRNRACIRLDHLRAVTHQENTRNRKPHPNHAECRHGHGPKATLSTGKRVCYVCVTSAVRTHRAKKS